MARFEIRRGNMSLRWEHPSATGEWEQSSIVECPGPGFAVGVFPALSEAGRQILLDEFELNAFAEELPLEKIRYIGPDALAQFKEEHVSA